MFQSWTMPPDKRLLMCQDLDLPTNDFQDKVVLSPARFLINRSARRTGKSYGITKRHFPMSMFTNSILLLRMMTDTHIIFVKLARNGTAH